MAIKYICSEQLREKLCRGATFSVIACIREYKGVLVELALSFLFYIYRIFPKSTHVAQNTLVAECSENLSLGMLMIC